MSLKINKQFGIYGMVAAGAVAAALYQTSAPAQDTDAKTQTGFSIFMHGDRFDGCAAHALRTTPDANTGVLKFGDDTVSVGPESITRLNFKRYAVVASTPERAENIGSGFKKCLVEQTFNPDVGILRTIKMP